MPSADFKPRTLADVLQAVEAAKSLPRYRRNALRRYVRRAAKLFGQDPSHLVADARLLARLKDDFTHREVGLTAKTWSTARSHIRAALVLAGCVSPSPPRNLPLSKAWQRMRPLLDSFSASRPLLRLMRYCTQQGIPPRRVDDAVVAQAVDWAITRGLTRPRDRVLCEICWAWNKAARLIPSWPKHRLTIPSRSLAYRLPWEVLPASFKADFEAWLKWAEAKDSVGEGRTRPIAAGTRVTYTQIIRQFAAALVGRGYDPGQLKSLADLVEVDAVKEGLRFYLGRAKPLSQARLYLTVCVLRVIAREWVGVGPAHVKQLFAIGKLLISRRSGLVDSARAQLRIFDDQANLRKLLNLPRRVMNDALRRNDGCQKWARAAQVATAIELLLLCPIRRDLICSLKLDRDVRIGSRRAWISIPNAEPLARTSFTFELPRESADLFRTYIEVFRPRLRGIRSRWLFPGLPGRAKVPAFLGEQITSTIGRESGLYVTPKTFRHLGAKLYLARNPGGYEVLRRVLGHRSATSTRQTYSCLEDSSLHRLFDERVLKLPQIDDPRTGMAASGVGK
jgi:integrase